MTNSNDWVKGKERERERESFEQPLYVRQQMQCQQKHMPLNANDVSFIFSIQNMNVRYINLTYETIPVSSKLKMEL